MDRLDYLQNWLQLDQAQAPVLLSGGSAVAVHEILTSLQQDKVEVVKLKPLKQTISIEEIRGWMKSLSLTSWAGRRLAIIEQAEKLSLPAANALLKSLEEPSVTTRYILITKWPLKLLPTIRSRCQPIKLGGGDSLKDSADEVDRLAWTLGERLRQEGPSRELRRALMRLRDYYQIRSLRGNEKLAKEVLFASLPPGGNI